MYVGKTLPVSTRPTILNEETGPTFSVSSLFAKVGVSASRLNQCQNGSTLGMVSWRFPDFDYTAGGFFPLDTQIFQLEKLRIIQFYLQMMMGWQVNVTAAAPPAGGNINETGRRLRKVELLGFGFIRLVGLGPSGTAVGYYLSLQTEIVSYGLGIFAGIPDANPLGGSIVNTIGTISEPFDVLPYGTTATHINNLAVNVVIPSFTSGTLQVEEQGLDTREDYPTAYSQYEDNAEIFHVQTQQTQPSNLLQMILSTRTPRYGAAVLSGLLTGIDLSEQGQISHLQVDGRDYRIAQAVYAGKNQWRVGLREASVETLDYYGHLV